MPTIAYRMTKPSGSSSARRPRSKAKDASVYASVRAAHASEVAEDYVEAIAGLIASQGEARVVDLAHVMGVTHVTVVRTIARLQREKLVTSQPYRAIFLTPAGQSLATRSRERHELVVAFLRSIGVPAPTAERDAEGIEHHCSPQTLAAFAKYVNKSRT
ncbi:MAG TPA: manganese-binding transcriptional regulator MntR [Phycisphaerales bacterium]|nr:manganese-binding transcriptional regulator MntR [Phycisphaerales bacterium]